MKIMKLIGLDILRIGFVFILSLASLSSAAVETGPDANIRAQKKPSLNVSYEQKKEVREKLGKLRIPFIKNEDMKISKIRYYANTIAGTVYIEDTSIGYALTNGNGAEKKGWLVKERLSGANETRAEGLKQAGAKVSYFKGKDRAGWNADIPTYEEVSFGEVYQKIRLTVKAYNKNIEKVFIVDKGGSPEAIAVRVEGAKSLHVNGKGELEIETGIGVLRMTEPVAYQEINGEKVAIEVKYEMKGDEKIFAYGFTVGGYNKDYPLVIDPLLASTFLKGSYSENVSSLSIDAGGNVYITGSSDSPDFPMTTGAYDTTWKGSADVYVAKLNNDLTTLLASTFIGGSDREVSLVIAIDRGGNLYVTGVTTSADFPASPGAYDTTFNGNLDAFVFKLSSDLTTLHASTFLGGIYDEGARSIAIDAGGNIFVTGLTGSGGSGGFPTTPGAYNTTYTGGYRDFLSKFNSDLTALLVSTFLDSEGDAQAIAIDSNDNIYVAGGYNIVFVYKLDNNLITLLASTSFGGSDRDYAYSIAIDSGGSVYVAGTTYSDNFPTTTGAYDRTFNGSYDGTFDTDRDAFVSKLDGNLTTLLASTFLGGGLSDVASSIAVDSDGDVYVVGITSSDNFPTTTGAFDRTFNGDKDAFVSKFDSNLATLIASTLLGGSNEDGASSIAIDVSGNVYAAGFTFYTLSNDFPTTPGAHDRDPNGWYDAFVSKFDGNLGSELQAVTLHTPNGGEIIPAGSTYSIQWGGSPEAVSFKLMYSMDNGLTWQAITTAFTMATQYLWTVPTPFNNKQKCRVKVIGYNNDGVEIGRDKSDSIFTIEVVKLISPNGAEILAANNSYQITWTTNATKKNVAEAKLYYSLYGGSIWKPMGKETGNDGSFTWTVPAVKSDRTKCKVKVVLKDKNGVTIGSDKSDSTFIIRP